MTIISHKHRFIFVRQRKIAGSSIMLKLSGALGDDDDLIVHDGKQLEYNPAWDETPFPALRNRGAAIKRVSPVFCAMRGHLPISEIIRIVGEETWNSYFKFTVVRNPWDWFASFYFFKMKGVNPYDENMDNAKHYAGLWLRQPWSVFYASRIWHFLKERRSVSQILKKAKAERHREAMEATLMSDVYSMILEMSEDFYFHEGEPVLDQYIAYENLEPEFKQVCERIGLPDLGALKRVKSKVRDAAVRDYRPLYTPQSRQRIEQYFPRTIERFNYRFDE